MLGGESLYDLLQNSNDSNAALPTASSGERSKGNLAPQTVRTPLGRPSPTSTSKQVPNSFSTVAKIPGQVADSLSSERKEERWLKKDQSSTLLDQRPPILTISKVKNAPRLDMILKTHHVPAISVAFLDQDRASICSRGVRKWGDETLVTESDTWYLSDSPHLGLYISVTISRLVDKGLLSWSSSIYELLPHLQDGIHIDHRQTSLEMLCLHTSGISSKKWRSNKQLWSLVNDEEIGKTQSQEAIVLVYFGQKKVNQSNVSRDNYVNMVAVALVLERVTSKPLNELFTTEVFVPLGMKDTSFWPENKLASHDSTDILRVWLHQPRRGDAITSPDPVTADPLTTLSARQKMLCGLLCTTSSDLCKLLHFYCYNPVLQNDRATEGARLLSCVEFDRLSLQKAQTPKGGTYTLGGLRLDRDSKASIQRFYWINFGQNSAFFMYLQPSTARAFVALLNIGGESIWPAMKELQEFGEAFVAGTTTVSQSLFSD